MLHRVVWWVLTDVSEEFTAFSISLSTVRYLPDYTAQIARTQRSYVSLRFDFILEACMYKQAPSVTFYNSKAVPCFSYDFCMSRASLPHSF
jgi:hypothetical protein